MDPHPLNLPLEKSNPIYIEQFIKIVCSKQSGTVTDARPIGILLKWSPEGEALQYLLLGACWRSLASRLSIVLLA